MKLRRRWFLAAALAMLVIVCSGASAFASTMVRHEVLTQYSWDAKVGLFIEFQNDQGKDGAVGQLKTVSLTAQVGDGSKFVSASYATSKWELGKDYVCKLIVKQGSPGTLELWVDGKKHSGPKINYVPFDAAPILNGVPGWAPGEATYKVLLKSLKVTTNTLNDYEAELDPASFATGQAPVDITDWRLSADDLDVTVDFVFSFAAAD
jgi:hypothetical protein